MVRLLLIASDGGVFAYGDAKFYGSTGGDNLAYPVTAAARSFLGGGYWIVDANGEVFNFGDAPNEASPRARRRLPHHRDGRHAELERLLAGERQRQCGQFGNARLRLHGRESLDAPVVACHEQQRQRLLAPG